MHLNPVTTNDAIPLIPGSTPYPGMGAREVMRRVRDGYRLERPSHCHPDLYKIIAKCWSGDMNKRPDFAELRLVSFIATTGDVYSIGRTLAVFRSLSLLSGISSERLNAFL